MNRAGPAVSVALLADTHGHLDDRIAALVADCDLAVHAGDVGGPDVLAALAPRTGRVIAIRGNNDTAAKWPANADSLLGELPEQEAVDLPGGRLIVVHGDRQPAARRHARLRRAHPHAAAVVYGHSHRLMEDRSALPWLLNPGAAGRTRTFGGPSCLVLHARDQGWRVTPYRFEPAKRRRAG